jgi:hypothetical protein
LSGVDIERSSPAASSGSERTLSLSVKPGTLLDRRPFSRGEDCAISEGSVELGLAGAAAASTLPAVGIEISNRSYDMKLDHSMQDNISGPGLSATEKYARWYLSSNDKRKIDVLGDGK